MGKLIHAIINDPREYMPFLILFGALVLCWGALCVSGLISLRTTGKRKCGIALVALILSLVGVWANIPIELTAQGFSLSFDFSWVFIIPALLSFAALALWWKAKKAVVRE